MALGPLSVGALHEVLAAQLGHSFARPTVVKVAAAVRGNPFYALEVAREVAGRDAGSPVGALPVPKDFASLVAARLRGLPRATREALLVVAALSNARLELLDRAALAPAQDAGLVCVDDERTSFSHPLFAAAVYGSAAQSERRKLHRRLAALVGDPEERARHPALAVDEASEEVALELEGAADRAVSRGAPDAAAELLELALPLTPSASERGPVRALAAAGCHFHAGDWARARSLAERVFADPAAGSVRGGALQLLGEIRYHEDSFREAIPLFEEALGLMGADPRAAELHVELAFAHWNLGNIVEAAAHGQAATEAEGASALPRSQRLRSPSRRWPSSTSTGRLIVRGSSRRWRLRIRINRWSW